MGKEWKRKGLDLAIQIVEQVRFSLPNATLTVYGVASDALPKSITDKSWVHVKGWAAEINWADFDILIHPAKDEPFGMVVAEARNHGLLVLMSSMVGAADLNFSHTTVVDIGAPLDEWTTAAHHLLKYHTKFAENKWSWNDLVKKHIDEIYPQVKPWTP